ncbi:MAG: outer rane autotransporter barrel domain protein [Xanthobacteraceae bacterium]|jgi:outer membrane autotransporter protein|nr:outer rane autotransporter barrel domain protein [Xanthobacteraceae bacterium]
MTRVKLGISSGRATEAGDGCSRRARRHAALLATTAVIALAYASPVSAQTLWTGTNSNNWFDPGNWSAGLPNNVTDAEVDNIAINAPAVFAIGANARDLTIGNSAVGTLVVQGAGVLLTTNGYIGRGLGSTGTVTVTDAESTWANTGNFYVGDQGSGSLMIANGGQVTSNDTFVGNVGSGLVTVTGTDSTWTVTDPLVVGNFGSGTVNVDTGGTVETERVTVGAANGSAGFLDISGGTTSWIASSEFIVGEGGSGTVTVSGGATVESQTLVLGFGATGLGQVTLTGPGTTWTTTASTGIGSDGVGHLRIEDGAALSTVGLSLSTGSGTVTGEGSSLTASGAVFVGASGESTLTVADRASVTSDGATIALLGIGTANVTSGANWTSSSTFTVGHSGLGTLNVTDGGTVNTLDSLLGRFSAGVGILNVDGEGSSFINTANMGIGNEGTGALSVTAGGTVEAQSVLLGMEANAGGSVSVTGAGSSLTSSEFLFVGLEGNGAMFVEDGGQVNSVVAGIGASAGGIGEATVSGATWLNSSDLFIGADGTGVLTITDGGRVEVGGAVEIAAGAGSSGTLNIGAGEGLAAAAPGTLAAGEIVFGPGTGAIVFNHTSTNYQFAAGMTGTGTIDLFSGTTVLTGNSSGFTGATTLHAGALAVNGVLGGTLDVLAGRLQGMGTVGSTTIAGGAVVAPGNSIGTLNVAGNATFAAGSIYEVELDPNSSNGDLVHATGTVVLEGGTVEHIGLTGAYSPLRTYTIVTADGGVDGEFAAVNSDFAFLDPTLSYDPNNVYLTLIRNDVDFGAVGLTPNQIATGYGAESLGLGDPVHDALLGLSAGQARGAFDLLSGEIHASAKSVLIDDSRFVREAAIDRVRAALGGVGASAAPVMAYGEGGPQAVAPTTDRFAIWGQGFGSWGQIDGDGNAAQINSSTGGFFLGADMPVFETWRLGVIAGYSRTNFDVDARASSGSSDNYPLGVYAGTQWGNLGFRSGLAYTWHEIDTSRSVAFPGFSESLTSSYDASTFQAFGELGYRIDMQAVAFEPFANVAYVSFDSDGFTEQWGAAALYAGGQTTDTTFTTLGLRVAAGLGLAGADVTLRGTLGWRHAFGDVTPLSTQAFAGGDPFTIAGVPIAENAAVVEAGLDWNLTPQATLGVAYNGQLASDAQQNGFTARLTVEF